MFKAVLLIILMLPSLLLAEEAVAGKDISALISNPAMIGSMILNDHPSQYTNLQTGEELWIENFRGIPDEVALLLIPNVPLVHRLFESYRAQGATPAQATILVNTEVLKKIQAGEFGGADPE